MEKDIEKEKEFRKRVKEEDCKGLTARCSECNYMWVIRKEKSIPAKCPKCNCNSIKVLLKDNLWYVKPLEETLREYDLAMKKLGNPLATACWIVMGFFLFFIFILAIVGSG